LDVESTQLCSELDSMLFDLLFDEKIMLAVYHL